LLVGFLVPGFFAYVPLFPARGQKGGAGGPFWPAKPRHCGWGAGLRIHLRRCVPRSPREQFDPHARPGDMAKSAWSLSAGEIPSPAASMGGGRICRREFRPIYCKQKTSGTGRGPAGQGHGTTPRTKFGTDVLPFGSTFDKPAPAIVRKSKLRVKGGRPVSRPKGEVTSFARAEGKGGLNNGGTFASFAGGERFAPTQTTQSAGRPPAGDQFGGLPPGRLSGSTKGKKNQPWGITCRAGWERGATAPWIASGI